MNTQSATTTRTRTNIYGDSDPPTVRRRQPTSQPSVDEQDTSSRRAESPAVTSPPAAHPENVFQHQDSDPPGRSQEPSSSVRSAVPESHRNPALAGVDLVLPPLQGNGAGAQVPPLSDPQAPRQGRQEQEIDQRQRNLDELRRRCSEAVRRADPLRQTPFSDPFEGAPMQNFDDFIERFEQRADLASWTEADRIVRVRECLSGPARRVYTQWLENGSILRMTLADIFAGLRAAFPGSTLDASQALTVFASIKQKSGESVQAYALRFWKIAKSAGLLGHESLGKRWCQSIQRHLRQPLLVFRASPAGSIASLDELVAYTAQLANAFDSESDDDAPVATTASHRSSKRDRSQFNSDGVRSELLDDESQQKRPATARPNSWPVIRNVSGTGMSDLGLQPADVSSVADAIVNRIASMTAESGHGRVQAIHSSPREIMAALPPAQSAQSGFFRQTSRGDGFDPSQSRSITCYGCGQLGHVRRNCPSQRTAGGYRMGSNTPNRPFPDSHRDNRNGRPQYRNERYQDDRWSHGRGGGRFAGSSLSGPNSINVPGRPRQSTTAADDGAQAVLAYLREMFNRPVGGSSEQPHSSSQPKN
jgi:hypothetical protein